MAKSIMIQGTMSNVGKSILTAGLCRVFMQDGYRVAPFKSQNMALNSFITKNGFEMGRAQVVQAEACGKTPDVAMNPVLLKPTSDCGSQVIVNGVARGNMKARDYFKYKKDLIPDIMSAYNKLSSENDIIVIEGAGSPAEINLKSDDIVNMGMAKMAHSPVLLVGDINPGGVFAQLAGTLMLLDDIERSMVKATIVNKFRGDKTILQPGLNMLEEITNTPVAGVVPMLDIDIDDEDSLSTRLTDKKEGGKIDIAVISLPHISNFTDFSSLDACSNVNVRYVRIPQELGNPDLIILPGTKNTTFDCQWIFDVGLSKFINNLANTGTPIMGICGGYQILGQSIDDRMGYEGGTFTKGLSLLPIRTVIASEKSRTQTKGEIINNSSTYTGLNSLKVDGYEIHMGVTDLDVGAVPLIKKSDGSYDGCIKNNIMGTYFHGIFDNSNFRSIIIKILCEKKGISLINNTDFDYNEYRIAQYDLLADVLRKELNIPMIYDILEAGI